MEFPSAVTDAGLRQRVIDNFARLASQVLRCDVDGLSPDARLRDELGMTSASTLELLLLMEDVLTIQIDVEELDEEHVTSVETLADFVVTHSQPAG
jgi:acyl carrier protein